MTIEQFAIKVLMKMGVYDPGDVLSSQDLENVQDAYNAVYQTLLDEGLVTWAATDDIPMRFSLPLIDLVAGQIKPYYGKPQTEMDMLPIANQPGTRAIRRQMAAPYIPEETQAEYF